MLPFTLYAICSSRKRYLPSPCHVYSMLYKRLYQERVRDMQIYLSFVVKACVYFMCDNAVIFGNFGASQLSFEAYRVLFLIRRYEYVVSFRDVTYNRPVKGFSCIFHFLEEISEKDHGNFLLYSEAWGLCYYSGETSGYITRNF
jgi:hypothetical protein